MAEKDAFMLLPLLCVWLGVWLAEPLLPATLLLFCPTSVAAPSVFLCWNFSRIDDSFDWYWLMRSVDVELSAPVPAGCACLFEASLDCELVPPAPATVFAADVNPPPSLADGRLAKPKRFVSELYLFTASGYWTLEAKLGLSCGLTMACALLV